MTLEEAIQHLEESLNDKEWSCESCKMEHEQLLKWLKELRRFREYAKKELERKKQELEAAQRALNLELAVSNIIQLNTRVPF